MEAILRNVRILSARILAAAIGVALASGAMAQASRGTTNVPATAGVPEFRDPKTGQVWTPETVGRTTAPPTGPQDKAFDPSAQDVPGQVAVQGVQGRPLGTVPITAGPSTPILAMDGATLRAVPGQRWQIVMYLDNNSGNPVDPVIECRFLNGGNPVMTTRALVARTGPGVRQGLLIYGPRTDAFVDNSSCSVVSP